MRKSLRNIGMLLTLLLHLPALSQPYTPYWEAPRYQLSESDSIFLEELQRDTFNWFWHKADAATGWTPDRSDDFSTPPLISIAAVGFGLTAYGIGSERGYVTRQQATQRVLRVLDSLLSARMGPESEGNIGYRGWYYHFLDANTRARTWDSELSTIDTALLLMGVIFVRNYFDDPNNEDEQTIRAHADSLLSRVDWPFMMNPINAGVRGGWKPETGYLAFEYRGYSEAMLLYLLGLGAEKNPLPEASWNFWWGGYDIGSTPHFPVDFIRFAPLFGHQYPQCWIDFRGLQSPELMKERLGEPYDYFENGRRAAYASRAYCVANPNEWPNYGELEWGLTACDGPRGFGFDGYFARGASATQVWDDGTIAPTAATGSIAYAPEIVVPTLSNLKDKYGSQLYGPFGFRDAYNDSVNWFDTDYLGIDQGPILIMIENFRTELVWLTMRKDPIIQSGLQRAGFSGGWLDSLLVTVDDRPQIAERFALHQNYPNPFNATTSITFELQRAQRVRLDVFNLLGQPVATLVDDLKPPGTHTVRFDAGHLSSGLYWYRLRAGNQVQSKKMLYLK